MAWAPDYVTADEMREYVSIDDLVDDVYIAFAITAASRAIDDHCNRQFGQSDPGETRYFTPTYDPDRERWVILHDDLTELVQVVVTPSDGTPLSGASEPRHAPATGFPYTRFVFGASSEQAAGSGFPPSGLVASAQIEGTFGWTAVPDAVKQATLIQANRLLKRRDAPFGVAGSPEMGSEMRLLARVDPDVAVTLRHYVRPRMVG